MDLVFCDLEVEINDKKILNKVSGVARTGDMLAVMGPSGAGKSTLLSALAGRRATTRGIITLGGKLIDKQLSRKMRFVLQQDSFFPNLTLRETLTFAALLTLPDEMPHHLKMQRIDEIIDVLELSKCSNTIMGNAFIPGLSGGERKRATIACEIITDCPLLLVDEPTSGLDYSSAINLVHTLKKLTQVSEKTIVASIHQPSSQMFYMFTNILLIADGQVIFFGPGSDILGHFANAGLHCKPNYNPADFVMEELRAKPENQIALIKEATVQRQKHWPTEIKDEYSKAALQPRKGSLLGVYINEAFSRSKNSSMTSLQEVVVQDDALKNVKTHMNGVLASNKALDHKDNLVSTDIYLKQYLQKDKRWPTGFMTQYKALTQRLFIHHRHQIFSKVCVLRRLWVTLFSVLIWFQLERTERVLNDRLGAIFFTIVVWGFDVIIDSVLTFAAEREIIQRERAAGMYRLSAYWMAKQTSELPLTLTMPFICAIIAYWGVGLNPTAWTCCVFVFLLLLYVFLIEGLGFFIGLLISDFNAAVTVVTVTMICFMLTGGYFQQNFPPWLSWMKYFSPVSYGFDCAMRLDLEYGADIECLGGEKTAFTQCTMENTTHIPGAVILEEYGVTLPIWATFTILGSACIFIRYAAYLVLRYIRRPNTEL